jgi:GntR family transcriptional regulator/MocR family aminotransferase
MLIRTATSGVDFLQLIPERAPSTGMTGWLVDALRAGISDGRLTTGAALPASRVLAADLGISRGVVVEAYRRLTDEGLIGGRQGAGTTVHAVGTVTGRRVPPAASAPPAPTRPSTTPIDLPGRQRWVGVDIDLSPGVPDLSAFPRAAWLSAERAGLAAATPADLGYGEPAGHPVLRRELAGWLTRTRGLRVTADDIVVVAGVAQSLALLCRVLRSRGVSAVAVEDPGSRGASDELRYWHTEPVPVPVDDAGLRVDLLADTATTAVLLTPAHQFPTGVVLAPERRRALAEWAAGRDGLVIEDDYDAEFRYDRAPVPALQASAPDRVAYAGSTSKSLSPGMRLGWLVPPPALREEILQAKHASDLGSPVIPQLGLAQLIAGGGYDRHIRLVRGRHRQRRDALLQALREQLPDIEIHGVAAGLHLIITLPSRSGADDVELADRIFGVGVGVQPLSWHRHRAGPAGLVIGYAAHPPDRLREAARRIGGVIRSG